MVQLSDQDKKIIKGEYDKQFAFLRDVLPVYPGYILIGITNNTASYITLDEYEKSLGDPAALTESNIIKPLDILEATQ